MMEFHICPDKGCCAFVANYSKHIYCKQCKDCRKRLYEDCTHTLKNRIAFKSIFYRPMTILLCSLLETEGFLTAYKLEFRDETVSYKYIDCSNGSTYKKKYKRNGRKL